VLALVLVLVVVYAQDGGPGRVGPGANAGAVAGAGGEDTSSGFMLAVMREMGDAVSSGLFVRR
jgi:hypothetical protein